LIQQLVPPLPASNNSEQDLRRWPLAAVLAGASVLAALPLLLNLAGTSYRPWRLTGNLTRPRAASRGEVLTNVASGV
jgi:hypothetical protein